MLIHFVYLVAFALETHGRTVCGMRWTRTHAITDVKNSSSLSSLITKITSALPVQ